MQLLMFTVYDSKAEAYLPPIYNQSRGAAVRAFTDTANDPTTMIGKHPEDYSFFEIASFNDASGRVQMHDVYVSLGVAIEYLEQRYEPLREVIDGEE